MLTAKLPDSFWRGRGAATKGGCLGLAIVGEIMKAHQGTVSVGDNPGGGAVVTPSFAIVHQEHSPP